MAVDRSFAEGRYCTYVTDLVRDTPREASQLPARVRRHGASRAAEIDFVTLGNYLNTPLNDVPSGSPSAARMP